MSIDLVVFLFGALVSLVVMSGVLLFYAAAFAEQANRQGVHLSARWQRVLRILRLVEPAPAPRRLRPLPARRAATATSRG